MSNPNDNEIEDYTAEEIAIGDQVESLFTEEEQNSFDSLVTQLNEVAGIASVLCSASGLDGETDFLTLLNGMLGEILTNSELHAEEVPDGARLVASAPAVGLTLTRQESGRYTVSLPVLVIEIDEELLTRFYRAVSDATEAQETPEEAEGGQGV